MTRRMIRRARCVVPPGLPVVQGCFQVVNLRPQPVVIHGAMPVIACLVPCVACHRVFLLHVELEACARPRRGGLCRVPVGTGALWGGFGVPWHAPVRGEHLRGEQPVRAVASGMTRIDLGQFCEPVPEQLHVVFSSGATTATRPSRDRGGTSWFRRPFVTSFSTPLIPDPQSFPRPADRQNFSETSFRWKHQWL
jgi:hypothetical protein